MSYIVAPYESTVKGNATLTIEEAVRYINNWDKWEKFIPQDILYTQIQTVPCRDVIGVHYSPAVKSANGFYPASDNNYYEIHHEREETIDNFRFEEWKGEWKRDVYMPAIGYRIPYQYQSVRLNKVWKECLMMAYPCLAGYEFDAYCPSYGGTVEIYVKLNYTNPETKEKDCVSLYVPVQALLDKNHNLIYERHFEYHTQYGDMNSDKEQGNKWKAKNLAVLKSEEYKKFCAKVDSNWHN